jgi:signal transduction histidine kinase
MVDPESAREAALRTVGTSFLRTRPLFAFPLIASTLITLTLSAAPSAQRMLAYVGFGIVGAFFASETLRHRTRPVTGPQLFSSLALTLVGIAFGCTVTGGATSPLLPIALAPVGVAFAAFGDDRRSRFMLALVVAFAIGLAVVPPLFPPLAPGGARGLVALALAAAALLLRSGVARISDAFVAARGELSATKESLLASNVERTTMLEEVGARVAHEVKNPLAAVKGLVELVAEDAPSERARERLAVAHAEIDRIEAILRDYLGFARPLGHYAPRPADVADVGRSVVALLESRAGAAGITLTAEGPSVLRELDVERLKEAVLNLTLNALDATPRGGHVALTWGADGAGFAFTVLDDGRGMDAATRAKVGTPFFTQRAGGVGLGVALARRAIELHGGTLTYAEGPAGRGTKVTITCPAPR